jgi:hypothetical protein
VNQAGAGSSNLPAIAGVVGFQALVVAFQVVGGE